MLGGDPLEGGHVDRLDEVMVETVLAGTPQVFIAAVPGDGDQRGPVQPRRP